MVETMIKKIFGALLLVSLLCTFQLYANTLNKETVERVKEATVFILMESRNNQSVVNNNGRGTCSGFVINDRGYIVTNYHCVHNATQLMLAFYDLDDWNLYDVEIIGIDPLADVAVIHIPKRKKTLPFLSWSKEDPWDGMDVFAVGHPFGMSWSITKGVISHSKRIIRSPYVRYIQTDSAINSGNSGGPLLNTAGNVVGINSLIINPNPTIPKTNIGMGLALRKDDAKEIVDNLVDGKEHIRPIVGVSLVDINPLNRDALAEMPDVKEAGITIPNTFGCLIAPTDDIPEGLEKFDTIVGIDGQAVNRQENLTDIIRNKQVGDTVELLIVRDRVYKNVTITLKKLEVTGAQLYDRKGNLQTPNPKSEEPKNEKQNDETQKEDPKAKPPSARYTNGCVGTSVGANDN